MYFNALNYNSAGFLFFYEVNRRKRIFNRTTMGKNYFNTLKSASIGIRELKFNP